LRAGHHCIWAMDSSSLMQQSEEKHSPKYTLEIPSSRTEIRAHMFDDAQFWCCSNNTHSCAEGIKSMS
jgi:hypothetical protein